MHALLFLLYLEIINVTKDLSHLDDQQMTVYEYHRVEIDPTKITNNSAFEFSSLPSKWCLIHGGI